MIHHRCEQTEQTGTEQLSYSLHMFFLCIFVRDTDYNESRYTELAGSCAWYYCENFSYSIIFTGFTVCWQFESISVEVRRNTDAIQQGQSELNDLRRQRQGLEIDLQTMHSMVYNTHIHTHIVSQSQWQCVRRGLCTIWQGLASHTSKLKTLDVLIRSVLVPVQYRVTLFQMKHTGCFKCIFHSSGIDRRGRKTFGLNTVLYMRS